MKWFVLFITLIQSFYCLAATRTVSNNPSTIAQFNTIQGAINASASGDTVLVHGSTASYGGFDINNKRIILIGPGFSPDIQSPLTAIVIGNVIISGSAAKKTEIHGMSFLGSNNYISFPSSIDSLYFYRNVINTIYVSAYTTLTGFVFKGNYFISQFSSHPYNIHQNFLFENNVFENAGVCLSYFDNPSSNNIIFNHNLFFSGTGDPANTFTNVTNVHFVNNIFVERNFDATLTQCTFTNNITFNCGPDNPWSINGNTDGGGNIQDMDPQMAAQAAVNNGSAGAISDFTISAGPANNAGSDGKDMGLLYDPIGWNNWIHGRNPRWPSITSMTIVNPVMVAGEMLQMNVGARKNE